MSTVNVYAGLTKTYHIDSRKLGSLFSSRREGLTAGRMASQYEDAMDMLERVAMYLDVDLEEILPVARGA